MSVFLLICECVQLYIAHETESWSAAVAASGAVSKTSDLVVLEGTGHTAVGSVVNLNNAQVRF